MRGAVSARLRALIPRVGAVSATERVRASVGALVGILVTGAASRAMLGTTGDLPMLIAPMGASAVLLFAVPSSPLAQPWSILGGNMVAALIGVTCGRLVADPMVAAPLAAGAAIAAMLVLRCLHPPSGAVALTAVLGGPTIHAAGYTFALWPVGLNSLLLLLAALLFNNLTGRPYPHRAGTGLGATGPGSLSTARVGFSRADLAAVLRQRDEVIDIDPRDLESLLRATEAHAYRRRFDAVTCADIMTTGVVSVGRDMPLAEALHTMQVRRIAALAVVGSDETLAGIVTEHQIFRQARWTGPEGHAQPARARWLQRSMRFDLEPRIVGDIMTTGLSPAAPATRIADLVPVMAEMGLSLVPVVAPDRRVVGMVTQAALVAALFRGSGLDPGPVPAEPSA